MENQIDLFDGDLAVAERTVTRARALHAAVFREAKRDVAYKRMLATRERCADFEARLLEHAKRINAGHPEPLPDRIVATVAGRVAGRIAAWEHSPIRQRERAAKRAAKVRRKNRGRDLQIVRLHEAGESPSAIAAHFGMSRSGVRHVLQRDAPGAAESVSTTSSVSSA